MPGPCGLDRASRSLFVENDSSGEDTDPGNNGEFWTGVETENDWEDAETIDDWEGELP